MPDCLGSRFRAAALSEVRAVGVRPRTVLDTAFRLWDSAGRPYGYAEAGRHIDRRVYQPRPED
jgi:hypothetical protein